MKTRNPVAKHNFNRPATHKPKKGKGSYERKSYWDSERLAEYRRAK